jgi:hypothetical protein
VVDDGLTERQRAGKKICVCGEVYVVDGGAAEMIHQVRVQRANHNRASTSCYVLFRARHVDDCDVWQYTVLHYKLQKYAKGDRINLSRRLQSEIYQWVRRSEYC